MARLQARPEAVANALEEMRGLAFTPAAAILEPEADRSASAALLRALALLNAPDASRNAREEAILALQGVYRQKGEVAIAAGFFLARIAEDRAASDTAARYSELAAKAPESPWAQRGLLRLAHWRLRNSTDLPAEIAELETWAARFTVDAVRRDFHLLLARTRAWFSPDPQRETAHWQAAERAGVARGATRGDLLVALGLLAEEQGQAADAGTRYRAFLAEFPNDSRAPTVRRRLAALAAGSP